VNYKEKYTHSYLSELGNGYQTQLRQDFYNKSEENAKNYYNQNYLK
jgi:hypothetical protein